MVDSKDLTGTLVILIFALAIIGILGTMFSQINDGDAQTDSFTGVYVNQNLTLSQTDILSLTRIWNGTAAIPESNYTALINESRIIILDNSSMTNGIDVMYNYDGNLYVGDGLSKAVIGAVLIIVAWLIILWITSYSKAGR